MNQRLNESLIGVPGGVLELQTPALILDEPQFDSNLAKMRDFCSAAHIGLRPHAKTHKCSQIAVRQINMGAVGICCAKVGEAEAMAAAGVDKILITSPVVSERTINRVLAMNRSSCDVIVVADNPDATQRLAGMASELDGEIGVLVDVDPGMHRTGVSSDGAAIALAQQIEDSPGLRFRGLQMYAGNLMHISSFDDRQRRSHEVMNRLSNLAGSLRDLNLEPEILTGGGTGTYDIDPDRHVLSDIQAGSYIFMDRQYLEVLDVKGHPLGFEPSLFVQTTVVSANHAGLATTDAGIKAFATDDQPPIIVSGAPHEATYSFQGDEHGAVRWNPRMNETLTVGSVVRTITPHCDPTVNLYDQIHVIRENTLIDIWEIDGRGRSA